MPWLNANGIKLNIAPKPAPRKSRWVSSPLCFFPFLSQSPDVSATAKAENIINTVTGKSPFLFSGNTISCTSFYPNFFEHFFPAVNY